MTVCIFPPEFMFTADLKVKLCFFWNIHIISTNLLVDLFKISSLIQQQNIVTAESEYSKKNLKLSFVDISFVVTAVL